MLAGFLILIGGLIALSLLARQFNAHGHEPTGQFIKVDGFTLHYEITGPEDGPTALVLHGASSSFAEPKLALETALADHRVIWLDRPGLGWSERPQALRWLPEHEASLIRAFLDAIDVEEVVIIGHSWGAAISLRLMLDYPDRVKGGVLIAPAIRAWVGEAGWYNKVSDWPLIGTLFTRIVIPIAGPKSLPDGVKSAFHPEAVPENYIENAKIERIFDEQPWLANAADMASVNHHLARQEERYHEITQPVIFLAGPDDTVVFTHRHARPVSHTVQNGELRLIEGAGHNLHHHRQDEVKTALEDVIARMTAR